MRPPKKPSTTRSVSRGSVKSVGSAKTSRRREKNLVDLESEDYERPARRVKRKRGTRGSSPEDRIDELKAEVMNNLKTLGEDDEDPIVSSFARDFEKLRAIMKPENENLRMDQTAPMLYRAALGMILDLLPLAEDAYRTSKKESAAYALTALLNQARDLNNDIRMSEDTEGQALVLTGLIGTTFLRIGDLLLREKYALETKVDALTANAPRIRKALKSELNDMTRSFIKGAQDLQELLSQQTRGYLMGDPAYLNPNLGSTNISKPTKKRRSKKG